MCQREQPGPSLANSILLFQSARGRQVRCLTTILSCFLKKLMYFNTTDITLSHHNDFSERLPSFRCAHKTEAPLCNRPQETESLSLYQCHCNSCQTQVNVPWRMHQMLRWISFMHSHASLQNITCRKFRLK